MWQNNNGKADLYDALLMNICPSIVFSPPPFNQRIAKAIDESKAFTASDASAKKGVMTGHWCIKNNQQQTLLKNHLCHKKWYDNAIVGAEAIVLLDLIEVLERKGYYTTHRKASVGFDNRIVYR